MTKLKKNVSSSIGKITELVKANTFARIAGDIFYIFNAPRREPKAKQQETPRKNKIIPIRTDYFTQEKIDVLAHVHGEIHGLPTTQDLTLWIAFLQIVYQDFFDGTRVIQPICFKSKDLLRKAQYVWDGDDAYETVKQWFLRMDGVQIHLQGEKLKAAARINGKAKSEKKQDWIIRTFSQVKMFGDDDGKGGKLDSNSVHLSQYMLDNIEHNLPAMLDFPIYRKIRNQTARLLLVHLQKWQYASRDTKIFEKDYADLCNLLGLHEHTQKSRIEDQFTDAIGWLNRYYYTNGFEILEKKNGGGWKIQIHAGEKREIDAKLLKKLGVGNAPDAAVEPPPLSAPPELSSNESVIFNQLVKNGVFEHSARMFIKTRDLGKLTRQIAFATEKADLKEKRGGFTSNRRDYIWGILKKDEELPKDYQTPVEKARAKEQQLDRDAARDAQAAQALRLEMAYDEFRQRSAAEIFNRLPIDEQVRAKESQWKILRKDRPHFGTQLGEGDLEREKLRYALLELARTNEEIHTLEEFLELDTEENLIRLYAPEFPNG